MTTALADSPLLPFAPRAGKRKEDDRSKSVRPAASAKPTAGMVTPAKAAVADDVLAVLAAFGLED